MRPVSIIIAGALAVAALAGAGLFFSRSRSVQMKLDDKTTDLQQTQGSLARTQALAADVSGTWRVTIATAEGTITGLASLKQTGDVVTGWVGPSEKDPIPITG